MNKKWTDFYTEKAKKDNYPSRSIYKLKEIQKKFNVIRKNNKILDLGCCPGSWMIYASELVKDKGFVFGIDIKPVKIKLSKNAYFFKCDVFDFFKANSKFTKFNFNSIISDMAPSTTGSKDVDAFRSYVLCNMAFKIANKRLVYGGNFVCKIFHGIDLKNFFISVKSEFGKCFLYRPNSTRKRSKEIYIIGLNKK